MTAKLTYRLHRYFLSSKPIFPVIVIFGVLGVLYSIKPMDVTSGFIISGLWQFFLMTFVALNIGSSENTVEEQILFLREKSSIKYYVHRELSLIVICGLYSLFIALGPVYVNIVNAYTFFLRPLTVYDVVIGFLLIFGSGLLGIGIGDLLNQRVVANRRFSLVITVLILVITVANEGIQRQISFFRFLNFILPPVMKPAKVFTGAEIIPFIPAIVIFIEMMVYYLLITGVKTWFMNKNRFDG